MLKRDTEKGKKMFRTIEINCYLVIGSDNTVGIIFSLLLLVCNAPDISAHVSIYDLLFYLMVQRCRVWSTKWSSPFLRGLQTFSHEGHEATDYTLCATLGARAPRPNVVRECIYIQPLAQQTFNPDNWTQPDNGSQNVLCVWCWHWATKWNVLNYVPSPYNVRG